MPAATRDSLPDFPDDAVLADIVHELAERVERGEPIVLDDVVREHAHHADELRRLFPLLQSLADSHSVDPRRDNGPHAAGRNGATGTIGDYEIVREIGRGGMGIVYEAVQISLHRRVALKVLPFAAALDSRALARFKQESLAAAQLDHPHIVHVHAVGVDRGVHYYAMQFIEGQSLAEVIGEMRGGKVVDVEESMEPKSKGSPTSRGPAPIRREPVSPHSPTIAVRGSRLSTDRFNDRGEFYRSVARLGIQVAEALDYAHNRGVLHRDVKPGNILIDDEGQAWIADFGLARIGNEGNLTQTGDVVGTLRYASPEQILAQRELVDQRTDIYSLGAMLYELLTLQPVFYGGDRKRLLKQIVEADPLPLRRIDAATPPELETIVLKCLEKDTADRYSTAREVAEELRRFLEYKPIVAGQPGAWVRIRKWSRRHSASALAGVVVLSAATILLSGSTVWVMKERDAARLSENAARGAQEEESRQAKQSKTNLKNAIETVGTLLTSVSEDALFSIPGATPVRLKLLENAGRQLDSLCENQNDPELLLAAASAFRRLGGVRLHHGEFERSLESLSRAAELLDKSVANSPGPDLTPEQNAERSWIGYLQASSSWDLGRHARAMEYIDAALNSSRHWRGSPANFRQRWFLVVALQIKGLIAWTSGQPDAASKSLEDAISVSRQDFPNATEFEEAAMRMAECQAVAVLGVVQPESRSDEALALLRQAGTLIAALESRLERAPDTILDRTDRPDSEPALNPLPILCYLQWVSGNAHRVQGEFLKKRGDIAAARMSFETAIQLLTKPFAEFPDIFWTRDELAHAYVDLSGISDRETAAEHLARAIELVDPHSGRVGSFMLNRVAWEIVKTNAYPNWTAQAVELARRAAQQNPAEAYFNTLGVALYRQREFAEAIEMLTRSLDMEQRTIPYNGYFLAMAHHQLGERDEALRWYERTVEWLRLNPPGNAEDRRFQQAAETLRQEAEELLGVSEFTDPDEMRN
jgi:serine/threonine protein kinase/tetratricopeptide (TPR) repeat protein